MVGINQPGQPYQPGKQDSPDQPGQPNLLCLLLLMAIVLLLGSLDFVKAVAEHGGAESPCLTQGCYDNALQQSLLCLILLLCCCLLSTAVVAPRRFPLRSGRAYQMLVIAQSRSGQSLLHLPRHLTAYSLRQQQQCRRRRAYRMDWSRLQDQQQTQISQLLVSKWSHASVLSVQEVVEEVAVSVYCPALALVLHRAAPTSYLPLQHVCVRQLTFCLISVTHHQAILVKHTVRPPHPDAWL